MPRLGKKSKAVDDPPPPPPPDDDDPVPPPPPDDIPPPPIEISTRAGRSPRAKQKGSRAADEAAAVSAPPAVRGSTQPVDPEYVDFTVVPILLRSGCDYTGANAFGEILKRKTDLDVKRIVSNPGILLENLRKSKIPSTETQAFADNLCGDMYFAAAGDRASAGTGPQSRKSFVYYRTDVQSNSPSARRSVRKSVNNQAGARSSTAMRQRASFAVGMQMVGERDEDSGKPASAADKFTVKTRKEKAESLSNDLADLLGTLKGLGPS